MTRYRIRKNSLLRRRALALETLERRLVLAAPVVLGVEVNSLEFDPPDLLGDGPQPSSWQDQRSYIADVVVTFSETVQLTVDDIRLTNLGVNPDVDADSDVTLTAANFSLAGDTLTLSFEEFENENGVLELEISPFAVNLGGEQLDGNGDGFGGDSFIFSGDSENRFYQLQSDFNNDGSASLLDHTTFNYWFGQPVGSSQAPAYVDVNGDKGISIFDFGLLAHHFGTTVVGMETEPALSNANITLDLVPDIGEVTMENGTKVVTVEGGTLLTFSATLSTSSVALHGYQLNFSNSDIGAGELSLDNWINSNSTFPLPLVTTLDSSTGNLAVASSIIGEAAPALAGTFDVQTPLTAGDFLLTANASGPFGTSVIGPREGFGISDFGDVIIRVTDPIPPTVTEVEINSRQVDPPDLPSGPQPTSWQQQRSSISDIVVTFSEAVQLTVDDIRLTNLGVNPNVDADVEVALTAANFSLVGDTLILSFQNGFVPNGVLELEIHPSARDLTGVPLDGNGDGFGGDSFIFSGDSENRFYQLESDFNNDGSASLLDHTTFNYWFGQPVGSSQAPAYVDMNGDGGISIFDFSLLAHHFGTTVVGMETEPALSNANITLDLVPNVGEVTMENGTKVVTVEGGTLVTFSATLLTSSVALHGYQLNFSNSDTGTGELSLDNWINNTSEFVISLTSTLDSPAAVASSLTSRTAPVEAGTFDVQTPFTSGDYRLTANASGPFGTSVIGPREGFEISDYGDVIIRVLERHDGVYTIASELDEPVGAGTVTFSGSSYVASSLRAALEDIQTNERLLSATIALQPGETYSLSSFDSTANGPTGLPQITKDLILEGNGAEITRDSVDRFRILDVAAGANLTLRDLAIFGGDTEGHGGGIYNAGSLMLEQASISSNSSLGNGGGIYSRGNLQLVDSMVIGNQANGNSSNGGGIYATSVIEVDRSAVIFNSVLAAGSDGQGGGIWAASGVSLTSSTVSNNSASAPLGWGGGIRLDGNANLLATHSTIVRNSSQSSSESAGGISTGGATIAVELHNTIVAENTWRDRSGGPVLPRDMFLVGPIDAASSFNLIGADSNFTGISNGDGNANQVGTAATPLDPLLESLSFNGGPTPTHALLPQSPAIDVGTAMNIDRDQRGFPLPVDVAHVADGSGGNVDVGAFEARFDLTCSPFENFDGVSAPNLPAGWTTVSTGAGAADWTTVGTDSDTPPNNAFVPNNDNIGDNQLISPAVSTSLYTQQLRFSQFYNTEPTYDGGVLEISINGGEFTDILAAGGSFLAGGYNLTLNTGFSNPLAGRRAWSGLSAGNLSTVVTLPTAAIGESLQFRWRLGTDSSVNRVGWRVDTVELCSNSPTQVFDFGDAPDSYGTLMGSDGARHQLGGPQLGQRVDVEFDAVTPLNGLGDDNDFRGDDDGVFIIADMLNVPGTSTVASMNINVSEQSRLDAWVDFDGDGSFEAAEQIATNVSYLSGGNYTLSFTVPGSAVAGDWSARFRLSSTGGLSPTGLATDGEVEDYQATILTGDGSQVITIDPPTGLAEVYLDGNEIVVAANNEEYFRAPSDSFAGFDFQGTIGNDTIILNDVSAAYSGSISVDTQGGIDALILQGEGHDIDLASLGDLAGIEIIDILGSGPNTIRVTPQAANDSDEDLLIVAGGSEDRLILDPEDWTYVESRFEGGDFAHVFTTANAGTLLSLGISSWQNQLLRFDVDGNGSVEPRDVVILVNRINSAGPGELPAPTAEFGPPFFFDVDGDGSTLPLDVIQIVNLINRGGNLPQGEGIELQNTGGKSVVPRVNESHRFGFSDEPISQRVEPRRPDWNETGWESKREASELNLEIDSIDSYFAALELGFDSLLN